MCYIILHIGIRFIEKVGMKVLKTVELFAGIGGFRIAAEQNGLETVWANDIDPIAVKVYKDNFGCDSIIEGDIYYHLDSIPDHDILTGGFPCQPFSKAGKKQGIADYRGTLFEVIVNILSKKHPKYFILENVNSLLYMDNGRHFRTILLALSSLDYKVEWKVFNAASFGLPQHRERVIIVGSKECDFNHSYFLEEHLLQSISPDTLDTIARYNQWTPIEQSRNKFETWGMAKNGYFISADMKEQQIFPAVKLIDILEDNVPASFDFTEDTLHRIESSQYVNKFYNGVQILYNQAGGARMGYTIFGVEGIAPTLTASTSRHYERYKVGETYRRLTNIEYARIQGFSDAHCNATTPYNQYKLYGNAVPPRIISYVIKKIINGVQCKIEKQTLSIFDMLDQMED